MLPMCFFNGQINSQSWPAGGRQKANGIMGEDLNSILADDLAILSIMFLQHQQKTQWHSIFGVMQLRCVLVAKVGCNLNLTTKKPLPLVCG